MWLYQMAVESWRILENSAPYILFGFLIAGCIHVLLGRTNLTRFLRGVRTRSVALASVIGVPLPLCSCSVLPAAMSLRRQGTSKGTTISFLISTPEINFQTIFLTYGLLGPVMAIYRPIAAFVTAMTAGLVENFFERREPDKAVDAAGPVPAEGASCSHCSDDHDHDHAHAALTPGESHRLPSWRDGLRHSFVDVFDDVVGWMFLGIAVAAVIQVLVPGFVIDAVFGSTWRAMLIMLIIGVPLYVCAEASTPIAAILLLKGVNPGAVLVFLLVGPATNIGSIGLLLRQFGRRTVTVYLASITVVSLAMGVLLNWLADVRSVNVAEHALHEGLLPGWLMTVGAVIFVVLSLVSMRRMDVLGKVAGVLDRTLPVRVTRARLGGAMIVTLVAGYLSTGLTAIQPGEAGVQKRFGRIVSADLAPGLHVHWPYPVDLVDRIETERVHRMMVGVPSADVTASEPDSWVLLGDENIANIHCSVRWRMAPGKVVEYAYAAFSHEELVRQTSTAALVMVMGGAEIETVFTTAQPELTRHIQSEAQKLLDASHSGIELVAFDFLDLHAPREVHESFRDVASALEEQSTRRYEALGDQIARRIREEGTRQSNLLEAQAYGVRVQGEAIGHAERFRQRRESYLQFMGVTRARLMFEMYDRVLPGLRKCIKPTQGNVQIELRFRTGRQQQEAPPL